jgi:hypothetical protein
MATPADLQKTTVDAPLSAEDADRLAESFRPSWEMDAPAPPAGGLGSTMVMSPDATMPDALPASMAKQSEPRIPPARVHVEQPTESVIVAPEPAAAAVQPQPQLASNKQTLIMGNVVVPPQPQAAPAPAPAVPPGGKTMKLDLTDIPNAPPPPAAPLGQTVALPQQAPQQAAHRPAPQVYAPSPALPNQYAAISADSTIELPRKSKAPLFVGLAVGFVVIAGVSFAAVSALSGGSDKDKKADIPAATQTTAAAEAKIPPPPEVTATQAAAPTPTAAEKPAPTATEKPTPTATEKPAAAAPAATEKPIAAAPKATTEPRPAAPAPAPKPAAAPKPASKPASIVRDVPF